MSGSCDVSQECGLEGTRREAVLDTISLGLLHILSARRGMAAKGEAGLSEQPTLSLAGSVDSH